MVPFFYMVPFFVLNIFKMVQNYGIKLNEKKGLPNLNWEAFLNGYDLCDYALPNTIEEL